MIMAIDTVETGVDAGGALSPGALADGLVEIAELAAQLEVRSFEERDLEAIREELVPAVRDLVERGLQAIDRILAAYDSPGGRRSRDDEPEEGNFYVTIDRVVGDGDRSTHVADLAFMARMELRDKVSKLRGADKGSDPWRVLAVCDGCIRRLRKAAAAVETAIADDAGIEARLQFVTEAHLAQVVRAYYARFRREIEGEGSPSPGTIHGRLLSAAASIAKLIGRDFYGDLRVSDRAELRSLQGRLRLWLRGEDGHDPASGQRLWQDLHGFAVLLAQINRRSELLEHDQAIVREALAELDALAAVGGAQIEVPSGLLGRLQRLKGRNDRIDRLLAEPITCGAELWITELRSLGEALSELE